MSDQGSRSTARDRAVEAVAAGLAHHVNDREPDDGAYDLATASVDALLASPDVLRELAGQPDELEEHVLDANERMGEALVAIGMALGLPRPGVDNTWGSPEILARIAEQGPARDHAGEHVYLSTSCLHFDHGYCQSGDGYDVDGDPFRKQPGQCKFCATPCVCPCHDDTRGTAAPAEPASVGLGINPEPLRQVPVEHRWASGLRGHRSRERQRATWVALGGDPDVWDAEHPLPGPVDTPEARDDHA